MSGAAGFVGANLVRRLLVEGHQVRVLLRPGGATWRLDGLGNDLERDEVDLRDADAVDAAVRAARPDWVFHLAASGAYSWQTDALAIVATNVLGTAAFVAAAVRAGFESFVHAGSSSEYGAKDHAPSEDEPLEPNSEYAVAKAAATMLCRHVAREQGLRLATLRLYSVYGPFEEPRRLVPTLIVRGLEGRLPPLVAPGAAHDFVHVDDVVDAFLVAAAAAPSGAVYNVGSGVQTSLREVVDIARERLDVDDEPAWGTEPSRPWDTPVWVADVSRIARELGWKPRTAFADGFGRTVDWLARDPLLDAVYRPALRASEQTA